MLRLMLPFRKIALRAAGGWSQALHDRGKGKEIGRTQFNVEDIRYRQVFHQVVPDRLQIKSCVSHHFPG